MLEVRRFTSLIILACALALMPAAETAAQDFPLFVADYRGLGIYSLEVDGALTVRGFVPGPLNSVRKDKGGNLFTCDEGSPTVSRIDAAGSVTAYATGFNGCFGLLFAPDGVLYVSNFGAGRIDAVPPGGKSFTPFASGLNGPMHMTFDTDGSILVTEFSAGRLSRVDAHGNVSLVVAGLARPLGVGVGPDNNMYVSEFLTGRLMRVDRNGSTSLLAAMDGAGPAGLAFHGDGRLFVAELFAGQIVTVDVGTGAVKLFRAGLMAPAGLSFDQVLPLDHPPVADAGTAGPTNEGSLVRLNGANSFDPDGDPLTFSWVQLAGAPVTLADADTATPTFTAPLLAGGRGESAILTFQLTVSDGALSSTDDVSVVIERVNHPPVADAGSPQTVHSGTLVTLNGSASSDPDGDPFTYEWVQLSGPPALLDSADAAMPSFTAPFLAGSADLLFQLTINDGLLSATATVVVSVSNDQPRCDLAQASPSVLWPPNRRLVPVRIIGVSDPDDDNLRLTIEGVTQDERPNGQGDGDIGPDALIEGNAVLIRAERSGTGDGRVYRINFKADDGFGETCIGSVSVLVPRSAKSSPAAVDSGQLYDSTTP
jgi:sugar lactone lactonase YvrE